MCNTPACYKKVANLASAAYSGTVFVTFTHIDCLNLFYCFFLFSYRQIVHLKRFQFVNHRWIKSHKAVHFHQSHLDMSEYLAAIPRETILRYRELKSCSSDPVANADTVDEEQINKGAGSTPFKMHSNGHVANCTSPILSQESTRRRLESTSLISHPVKDEELHDFHQHRLLPGYHKLDVTYSLYAAVVRVSIVGSIVLSPLKVNLNHFILCSVTRALWEEVITYPTQKIPTGSGSTITTRPAK